MGRSGVSAHHPLTPASAHRLGALALAVALWLVGCGSSVSAPPSADGVITVSPVGSDAASGSAAAPFRSLKRALTAAVSGGTIQLMDGVYDARAGETWGYVVPADVRIEGQTVAGTRLVGTAAAGGPGAVGHGLEAGAGLTLRHLSMEGFTHALTVVGPGAVTLDGVDLRDNQGDAINVTAAATGAVITVGGGGWGITSASAGGISLAGAGARLTITGGAVDVARSGILIDQTCLGCVVDIAGTTIKSGSGDSHGIATSSPAQGMTLGSSISVRGVTLDGDLYVDDGAAMVTVTDARLTVASANSGIYFRGTELRATDTAIAVSSSGYGVQLEVGSLVLSGVTIEGGTYGVYHNAGVAKLRGSTIKDFTYVGYYLATGELDLGTPEETGGNAFTGPDSGFCLYVARLGGTHPVTCSNTSFNGQTPAAGEIKGAYEEKGRFFVNVDEVISFSVR